MSVPALLVAYVRRNVPQPPPQPRGTRLQQRGQIRLGPDRAWMPFTAEQTMAATETRFVWRARFTMAPLLTGVVEDAFEDGHGRLDARLWGLVPVAHARGGDVDRSEAQRYLAELVWCPTAFLDHPGLHFRAIDERTVRVWVLDAQT